MDIIINDTKHYAARHAMGTERLVTLSVPSGSSPIARRAARHIATSINQSKRNILLVSWAQAGVKMVRWSPTVRPWFRATVPRGVWRNMIKSNNNDNCHVLPPLSFITTFKGLGTYLGRYKSSKRLVLSLIHI